MNSCVIFQVRMPRCRMMNDGIAQITTSMAVECAHVGAWVALKFDARYRHANQSVGTTTISRTHVGVAISDFSATRTLPFGSSTPWVHPERNEIANIAMATHEVRAAW